MKSSAAAKNSKTKTQALDRGRQSFRKRAWASAFSELSAADRESPLGPDDLQRLSMAAHLSGREANSLELLARTHQSFLNAGETLSAARSAFWLGFIAMNVGEMAQASGWLARAGRLLDGQPACVEQGYVLLPVGIRAVREGNVAEGTKAFLEAAAIGNRFGDKDLVTMALNGQGRALIRGGEISRGVTLLDEAMVAVMAGEVSPIIAGAVYCSVLDSCHETFDFRRAREWTAALNQWCVSQPELVPYRGHCLLQRAELLQLRGAWREALEEAEQAREKLSIPTPKPAVGAASYRMAELHRLQGKFAEAEEFYRLASQQGYAFQPGAALLRLAQGHHDAANTAIRRLMNEVKETSSRPEILEACVEIALTAKDLRAARAAAEELLETADRHGALILHAVSTRASGAVLLAEGDPRAAFATLRQSWNIWCELEAPYEAARARVLIALACKDQGDNDAAELELTAAREVFQHLGAAPDLARLEALSHKKAVKPASPLTARELQVLKLVASGVTNRHIANKLYISEKTVARHLSNIFNKLDLSSRAAATAYAYQHKLIGTLST